MVKADNVVFRSITQTTKTIRQIQAKTNSCLEIVCVCLLNVFQVPIVHKKEEIFQALNDYNVPHSRATWLIRMNNAYNVAIAEASKKLKRAAMPDPHTGKHMICHSYLLYYTSENVIINRQFSKQDEPKIIHISESLETML